MVKVEAENKDPSKQWSGFVVGALIVIFIAMATMSLRTSSYFSLFGRTSIMPCQCSKVNSTLSLSALFFSPFVAAFINVRMKMKKIYEGM